LLLLRQFNLTLLVIPEEAGQGICTALKKATKVLPAKDLEKAAAFPGPSQATGWACIFY